MSRLPSLFFVLHLLLPTAATAYQIIFADYTTSAFSVLQTCHSDGLPDICCEILDLDVRDKRGYGWFRATQVVFRNLESPDTRAAVFGRGASPPSPSPSPSPPSPPAPAQRHKTCVGGILVQKKGDKDWVTDRLRGEGAGSAAVVTGVETRGLVQAVPRTVVLRGRTFRMVGREEDEVLVFTDAMGNVVTGRRLGVEGVVRGRGNGTGVDVE